MGFSDFMKPRSCQSYFRKERYRSKVISKKMKSPVNGRRISSKANSVDRIYELEHRLAAERQRTEALRAELEKSRRWARAWKCAAKSNLELIKAVRNLRHNGEVAGTVERSSSSQLELESFKKQLAEAQRQIEFLERECQRWKENAVFYQDQVDELSLIAEELKSRLREEI